MMSIDKLLVQLTQVRKTTTDLADDTDFFLTTNYTNYTNDAVHDNCAAIHSCHSFHSWLSQPICVICLICGRRNEGLKLSVYRAIYL